MTRIFKMRTYRNSVAVVTRNSFWLETTDDDSAEALCAIEGATNPINLCITSISRRRPGPELSAHSGAAAQFCPNSSSRAFQSISVRAAERQFGIVKLQGKELEGKAREISASYRVRN